MHPRLLGIPETSPEARARIAAMLASLPPYTPPPPLAPGQIQLDASPDNAPCCLRIVAADGRDLLIQTDWDWPGIAATFGWRLAEVQREGCQCEHDGTDGTIACPACGLTAGDFITSAREWLDANDGAIAEDPGYFS